jgi:hypothetical protein
VMMTTGRGVEGKAQEVCDREGSDFGWTRGKGSRVIRW